MFTKKIIKTPLLSSVFALGLAATFAGCSDSEPHAHDDHGSHADAHKPAETETAQDKIKPAAETAATVRSADSHVHGGATLSVVSEANDITVEFETPLYNLLGFEYAPQTSDEKALVEDVEKTLASLENLVQFNDAAKCTYQAATTDVELFDDHAEEHDAHEDHDEENHDEEKDHHDEDEHHDDEHDDHEDNETHKDVVLTYTASCRAIDKLKSVRVSFFDVFPNFKELELVYLGPSTQLSQTLSSSKPNADLTR